MQYAPTNQKCKKGIMYCNCGSIHRTRKKLGRINPTQTIYIIRKKF